MTTREVSVDEIIEAAEKNGFIHCRGAWMFSTYPSINNNHDWLKAGDKGRPITSACIMGQVALNLGVEPTSLENALDTIKIVTNSWLKHHTGHSTLGVANAAINYNDHTKLSYNKIAEKVRAWLEPHRGKTFTLTEEKLFAKRKNENDKEYLARLETENEN